MFGHKNIIMQSNNPSWQSESFFFNRYIKKEVKKINSKAVIWLLHLARWHWFIPSAVICHSISWSMPSCVCLYTALWNVVSTCALVQEGLLKNSDCLYFAGNWESSLSLFSCFVCLFVCFTLGWRHRYWSLERYQRTTIHH